jgi:hypothetical protein
MTHLFTNEMILRIYLEALDKAEITGSEGTINYTSSP